MKSDTTALHLPLDMYSPTQVSGASVALQRYRSELRDAEVRAKAGTKGEKPDLNDELAHLLKLNNVKPDDGPALETITKQLEDVLKNAPVMHVVLAGPANRTLKRQLAVWFRTQIHPLSLLTFTFRTDIGGGIILQAGSHMYDYSFRAAIIDNKQRLMEFAASV